MSDADIFSAGSSPGSSLSALACQIRLPYDDTWPGLAEEIGAQSYAIEEAPWFDAARPESREFAGVWVMDADGFDSVPVSREVGEAICAGGVANKPRPTSRTVTFSALILASSNAGAEYGRNWLTGILRLSDARGGTTMSYFKAHPDGTAMSPTELRRTAFGVVMTSSPTVAEMAGLGGSARHRQASIYRVEWEMVWTKPYAYGYNQILSVLWNTEVEESITWAHAPDCEDTGSCELPTIFNAECALPEVPLVVTDPPTCGGCLPLCSIQRRTWQLAGGQVSDEVAVSLRVTNESDGPLTVNFYWQPCGLSDVCDRTGLLQVSGLPEGMTVVADSVSGRPYIDNGGVQQRQVGIVSTPSGAPWTPLVLDTVMCWELVAESAPGVDYSVIIEMRDRDT